MAGFMALLGVVATVVVFIGGLVSGAGLGMSLLLAFVVLVVVAYVVSLVS